MVRHMNRTIPIVLIVLALAGLLTANKYVLDDLMDIDQGFPLPEAHSNLTGNDPNQAQVTVRIGVISRFAPNIIYAGYQPIMDYLNRHGTRHYELRLSTSYQDAVDRLEKGEVTASFLGSWITSRLEPGSKLVPLVAPLNRQGKSEFHAVLVTHPDSDLESLEQLVGRKVALPSEQSWSGNWLQSSGLAQAGLKVADLDSIHNFDHHQTVVWQVLGGQFDAGVVKESVAQTYIKEGLRTVTMSAPIPGPPLVGNFQTDSHALEEISGLLLALDPSNEQDRQILESWTEEFSFGFRPVKRENYRNAFRSRKGD